MLVVVKLNHWYLYIKSESGTGLYDGLIVVDDGFRKAYAEKNTDGLLCTILLVINRGYNMQYLIIVLVLSNGFHCILHQDLL